MTQSMLITPFFFGSGDSADGPRFGGPPPTGISPREPGEYLLTVPVLGSPNLELSLFLRASSSFIGENQERWLSDDSMAAIVHPLSQRGTEASAYPGCSLHLMEQMADSDTALGGSVEDPYSTHKLGGRPYLIHGESEELLSQLARAEDEGLVQLLQLDIPVNPKDHFPPGVSWPFGDGIFHLFARPPYDEHFFWFWEYQ